MKEQKTTNLTQPEWKEVSVQEFLGLTETEMAYIELKVSLAKQLRRLRQKHNLSQSAFAEQIQSSQSRVAKMEKADNSVSLDLLVRSLLALNVTTEEIGQFLAT